MHVPFGFGLMLRPPQLEWQFGQAGNAGFKHATSSQNQTEWEAKIYYCSSDNAGS